MFAPMKGLSSYQKQKAEIANLRSEIITLVRDEDFMKCAEIKSKYKYILQQEAFIWVGNATEPPKKVKVNF